MIMMMMIVPRLESNAMQVKGSKCHASQARTSLLAISRTTTQLARCYYLLFLGLFIVIVENAITSANCQSSNHIKTNFSSSSWSDKAAEDFEQPIVISSVHSTGALPASSSMHQLASGNSKRRKPQTNNWPTFSQTPRVQPQPQVQSQQPSQEFDQSSSNRMGQQHQQVQKNNNSWPPRHSTSYIDNSGEQIRQRQTPLDGAQTPSQGAPYAAVPASSTGNRAPTISQTGAGFSLIRDTSLLELGSNLNELDDSTTQTTTTTKVKEADTQQQQQQQLWMQSIRDNHVGPVRSRFSLPAGAQQHPRPVPVVEGGFHMRAKPLVFNSQHQDWQALAAAANNKAARNQPQTSSGNTTSASSTTTTVEPQTSRRNSKFTRQPDHTTTTTTTPLPATFSPNEGDIATGSGQVTPINETNLLLLASNQRFEIDAQAQHHDTNDDNQVTSNNHSTGQKKRTSANQKHARSLALEDKDQRKQTGPEWRQSNGQVTKATATGGWARLLPALYQRTIGGVFRRITGATSQQQQQVNKHSFNANDIRLNMAPMVEQPQQQQFMQTAAATQTSGAFHVPGSINNLFASALSLAAQVIGQQQQQQQQHQQDLQRPTASQLMDEQNSKQASQLHESMMASMIRPSGPSGSPALKQHANKKIIDSFIDLPASERRSSSSILQTDKKLLSKRADLQSGEVEKLKAEPRLDAKLTKFPNHRKAKTDWKQPDQVEETEEFETHQPIEGQQDQTSPNVTHEELNAHDNSMIEFDFRTTTERPGQVAPSETLLPESVESAANEEDDKVETDAERQTVAAVERADEQEDNEAEPVKLATGRTLNDDENGLNEATSGQDEFGHTNNNYNEGEDLISEASEQQEQPVFFYAPQSSQQLFRLMSRKPDKQQVGAPDEELENGSRNQMDDIDGEQTKFAKSNNHQKRYQQKSRPFRRPPMAPIEPNPFIPEEDAVDNAEDDEDQREFIKATRRRRPSGGTEKIANHIRKNQVPPIGLLSVKPVLKPQRQQQQVVKKTQVSLAPKPLSVLAPSKEQGDSSSAMVSPLSSSINVMDLDPSMTRLAHNKLIVAKYKPTGNSRQRHRNKLSGPQLQQQQQQQYARSSSLMPPVVTAQTPVRPSNVDENGAELEPHKLDSSEREIRPTEPTSVAGSLASVVLGSRVMTNKHISEIVSRWTRPMTLGGNNMKPTSSRLHEGSTSTTIPPLVSQPEQQAANSLVDQSIDLDGRAGQQQQANRDTGAFADSAATHWRHQQPQPSRNEKFNFSLMAMNNRERINPLMFPMEAQRTTNFVNGTSINKNKPNRVRVVASSTTTTSTTTTTTTSTSTTKAPRPYRSTTSHSPRTTTSTTTTTAPSPGPPTGSSTTSTTTTTVPKVPSAAPTSQAESLIGQIVRSQHKVKPIASGGNLLLASPEHIRLRNQYLALVGGRTNNSLNSLSLLNNLLLHARSSPRPVVVTNSQPTGLEEAAHEANKYQLDPATSSSELSNINEHSIVIMSDNHHQQPIRRIWPAHSHTPAALDQPLVASMHYTSQPVTFEPELQPPSTTMAPAQRKHLEELVNGTRVRPSSQIKATTTTSTTSTTTESSETRKRDHNEQDSSHHSAPVMLTANHSKRNNSLSMHQHPNNQLLEGLEMAKLDDRAQELLMDLFDRDPAYSANLFAAHQLKTKQQLENVTQTTTPGPQSTDSVTLTPTTERSGQPSEKLSSFPTSPAPYDRPEVGSSQSTPSSEEIHQARSTDSLHRRHYDGQQHETTTSSPQAMGAKSSDEGSQATRRVSMRNNQATIEALIRDMAKRNNGSSLTSTTAESDLISDQLDLGVQYAHPTPPTTRWADIIMENDKDNMSKETSGNEHETTKFYSPFTSTTVAFQTPARYPSIDTLSPGRQKINRPIMESFSSGNNRFGPTSPPTSSTLSDEEQLASTKLTETASNNDKVRSSIRNRVTSTTESYVRPDHTADETTIAPTGTFEHIDAAGGDDLLPLEGATGDQEDYDSELINRKPTGASSSRPMIIRSRPRPPATSNQQHRRPQRKPIRVNINNNDKVISVKSTPKKRKRPAKRPQQTSTSPTTPTSTSPFTTSSDQNAGGDHLVLEPVGAGESNSIVLSSGSGEEYGQPGSGEAFILRPSVVSNGSGGGRPTTTIIRKRPTYVRLPPDNIRIHDKGVVKTNFLHHNNKMNKTNGAGQSPISIMMPMESVIKRKDQDIRTRPVTIIDQTGTAHDLTIEQTNELPAGLTRVPGTSILHSNMVVTYKPGRPLNQPVHPTTPIPFLEPSSGSTSLISDNELDEGQRRPQLGSGNGGDTLLVSIEQQEALKQQAAARRPTTTTSVPPTTTITTTEEPATTTSTPAPTTGSSMAQRPIIVISGLNLGQAQHNGSHSNHHHGQQRPGGGGGKHTASSLVEAASNSVVASASHGPPANNSRPWSGANSAAGGVRHNSTVSSMLSLGNSSSTDNNGYDFGSSNLTDSIVGPDMPNFGSSWSSSSSSSSSGSSSSHSTGSSGNPHIGMPNLGHGSSLFGQRPGNLRPQSWRRRRPNGSNSSSSSTSGSSNQPYDYQSASSVSSIVYRPIWGGPTRPAQSLAQMFNFPTLSRLYENIVIFFTRIRSFLISLLVVFLPPLALTASIVNVMSS